VGFNNKIQPIQVLTVTENIRSLRGARRRHRGNGSIPANMEWGIKISIFEEIAKTIYTRLSAPIYPWRTAY
jgi:hypothetical protein